MDPQLYRELLLERLAEVEDAVDHTAALRPLDYVLLVCVAAVLPAVLMVLAWSL